MTNPIKPPGPPRQAAPSGVPSKDAYYTDLGIDLSWTGNTHNGDDLLSGEATADTPMMWDEREGSLQYSDEVLNQRNRGFARYSLIHNLIQVSIRHLNKRTTMGRAINASISGMWIRCEDPLPAEAFVRVDLTVMDGYVMSLAGQVTRASHNQGMAIRLQTNDSNWRFRSSFLDLARTPSKAPPRIHLEELTTGDLEKFRADQRVLARLRLQWDDLKQHLADDARHQQFIQACLEAQRLEFALERYRNLDPSLGFDSTPYLKQIGTILTFYTLSRSSADEAKKKKKRSRFLPFVLVLLALLLAIIVGPSLGRHFSQQQEKQSETQNDEAFPAR